MSSEWGPLLDEDEPAGAFADSAEIAPADSAQMQTLKGPNIDDWEAVEKTPATEMALRYSAETNKSNMQKFGNQYGPLLNAPIAGFEKLKKLNLQLR